MERATLRRIVEFEVVLWTAVFAILLVPARNGGAVAWISGAAAFLALASLAFLVFWNPNKPEVVVATKRPKATPAPRSDYKGDVHQVVDLEGIGPAYAERLHQAGILHTQQLLWSETDKLAAITKAPAKTVESWKAMSQLVKVNGIGPQYAEALVRSGITSIDALKRRSAAKMADDVNAYLDGLQVNVLGQKVSQKRIETWQRAAKNMRRGPIDLDTIKVRALESRAAKAGAA